MSRASGERCVPSRDDSDRDSVRSAKFTPDRQVVGGWLTHVEGIAFAEYAYAIGIDEAALATILLVRELNSDRLSSLPERQTSRAVIKQKRVSAGAKQMGLKSRFAKHASKHGLSSDAAAAALFRAELRERWLGKCVGLAGNQVDSQAC